MARRCEVPGCEKGVRMGKRISRRGISKKAGGIGLKITGVNTRRFLPNLQRVKVNCAGHIQYLRVCTRCLKAGKVAKASPRLIAAKASH